MSINYWENYYSTRPLDQIPWQKTQADWFKSLVDSGLVKGESALDLGCGTGKKSIYLAQNGFKRVVGVDASKTALKYAQENAREVGAENVQFISHDITDLSFLEDEKFDLVLDWAALHCLEENLQKQYIEEIVKHTGNDSFLILRVFSTYGTDKAYFLDEIGGQVSKVMLFSKEIILDLYGQYFEITHSNRSKPRTKDGLCFEEYLMKRK